MNRLLFYNIGTEVEAFSTMRDAELPYPVTQPHQTHEDRIALIDRPGLTREDLEGIDALITNLRDCAIGVRTADCIPVLMYDPVHHAVAAVHCGWKSTVKHISGKAIARMAEEFGTVASDLRAIIGPGIGPDSFQVQDDVVNKFAEAGFPMNEVCRFDGPRIPDSMIGGYHIDLWRANEWLLREAGLKAVNISISGICTYTENDRFYSARREGTKCPRIINSIRLR